MSDIAVTVICCQPLLASPTSSRITPPLLIKATTADRVEYRYAEGTLSAEDTTPGHIFSKKHALWVGVRTYRSSGCGGRPAEPQ